MKILFLCRDNGARSQMAEALARQMYDGVHEVASAGVTAGTLHPLAVAEARAAGLDLSRAKPKALSAVDAASFDLVVLVGERNLAEALPPKVKHLQWPLMDPLDPPAPEAELRSRMRDLQMALAKHVKAIGKMRPGGAQAR